MLCRLFRKVYYVQSNYQDLATSAMGNKAYNDRPDKRHLRREKDRQDKKKLAAANTNRPDLSISESICALPLFLFGSLWLYLTTLLGRLFRIKLQKKNPRLENLHADRDNEPVIHQSNRFTTICIRAFKILLFAALIIAFLYFQYTQVNNSVLGQQSNLDLDKGLQSYSSALKLAVGSGLVLVAFVVQICRGGFEL